MNMNFVGGLAGGAADGFNNGADIMQKLQGMAAQHRMRLAQAGMADAMAAPQPPMPGQPSMPAGAPQGMPMPAMAGGAPPPPMAMPGAMPPPQFGGGAPPPPMAMPGASAAPPMPGAAPPMPDVAPGGMPAPAAAAPMEGPPAQTGMSGVAEPTGQGLLPDTQKTLQNIFVSLARANPNLKGETLFQAANNQIEMMKGLSSDARIYMQGAIAAANNASREEIAVSKATNYLAAVDAKIAAREEELRILTGSRERIAGTQAGARTDAARIGADSRRDVAGTQAGARTDAARIGADSRRDVADTNAGARTESATIGSAGRVDAASVGMGGKPVTGRSYVGKPAPPSPNNVLPPKGKFKTPEAVRDAPTLTREQKAGILRRDFGFK